MEHCPQLLPSGFVLLDLGGCASLDVPPALRRRRKGCNSGFGSLASLVMNSTVDLDVGRDAHAELAV